MDLDNCVGTPEMESLTWGRYKWSKSSVEWSNITAVQVSEPSNDSLGEELKEEKKARKESAFLLFYLM